MEKLFKYSISIAKPTWKSSESIPKRYLIQNLMKDAEFFPHLHSCLQLLKVKGKKLIDFCRSWVTVLKIYISKSNRSFQEVEISSVQSCWIIQFKSGWYFRLKNLIIYHWEGKNFPDYISQLHLFAKFLSH